MTRLHKRWSTYATLVTWGAAGFMAQPSVASFVVHFTVIPAMVGVTIYLARKEGRYDT